MQKRPQEKMKEKMSDKDEGLLRRLASANPHRKEHFSDYAGSEEAREAFARVLARERESARQGAQARKMRGSRLLWIAAATALVVVAVVLSLVCLGMRATATQVAITSGPSSAAAPSLETVARPDVSSTTRPLGVPYDPTYGVAGLPSGHPPGSVLRSEALSEIVQLAGEITSPQTEYPHSPELGQTDELLREAKGMGIVRASEGPDHELQFAITRKDYALWLWRAFGRLLTPTASDVCFTDLGSLSAEEQPAIAGLARAGILEGFSDGTFGGNALLLQAEEQTLLTRIRQALTAKR